MIPADAPPILAPLAVEGLADALVARCAPAEVLGLEVGDAVGVRFAAEDALLFDGAGRRVRGMREAAHV